MNIYNDASANSDVESFVQDALTIYAVKGFVEVDVIGMYQIAFLTCLGPAFKRQRQQTPSSPPPPPPITSISIIPTSTSAVTPTTIASTPATCQKSLFIPSTSTFTITTPIYRDAGSDLTCPRIGLVGRMGIYRAATEALAPGALTYTHRILFAHIRKPHGPIGSHLYPQQRNSSQYRHA
nr:unnamed protein product [Spirometra erinaceieuropaei]